jgi:hypothetical protein
MTATAPYAFVPLSQTLPFWPSQLADMPGALDELGVRDFHVDEGKDLLKVDGTLLWFEEIAFDLPAIDGFSVAFLSADGYTAVPFEIDVLPEFGVKLPNLDAALRIQSDVLKPVLKQGDNWVPALDATGKPKPVQIELSGVGLAVTASGDIDVTLAAGGPKLSLGAVALGETGVVLEVLGVTPYLSTAQTPPTGAPPGFRGVGIDEVKLHLPPDLDVPLIPSDLQFDHLVIGTSGFSGSVTGTWTPTFVDGEFTGNGSGSLFGIPFGLESLSITFKQNVPTASEIRGVVFLPFFDNPVSVDVALGVDGSVNAALSAVQPQGMTYSGGLVTLEKQGILSFELDAIGFEVQQGVVGVSLSGKLTPELGGLDWPTFELKELGIDSKGNVHLDGGWLDLPSGYALDLFGFTIEVTKVGFGRTDDGGQWVGFSGGVSLVTGLPAGASVDGLRVTWFEDGRAPQLTLNGVGVEFEVPDVVHFKGAVAYHELPGDVHRFDGSLMLAIEAIDFEIDGQIVIGSTPNYVFLALFVDCELPAGIPLWATGLGLYGMAGLFALNMEPGKTPDQDWYAIPPSTPVDWFHTGTPGVSDLTKWTNRDGSLGFGAGVTIGTEADDGYTFAAKVLLVIVFPGPIIMLDGAANLLTERAELSEDPLFHLLAVLDNRAGSVTLGLDAKYKYDDTGSVIDVHGSAETFFSYADPTQWFIYVGEKDPTAKRIRANLFGIFEANAYFMLDPRQLAMGAWVGLDKHWNFGPAGIDLEAWLEGDALLNFKPPHFHGELSVHGKIAVHAFGVGASMILDSSLTAEVDHPFDIVGKFHAALDLPWPLPSFSADVSVEWGPQPTPPPLPVPLKEIAIEHFKVTTSWPLAAGGPLRSPNYDRGDGFLSDPPPAGPDLTAAPPATAPVVPLDARPHITFGRAVNDDALVGVNPQPPTPGYEQIGDPTRNDNPLSARYGVTEVSIDRWDTASATWVPVARKAADANAAGVPELYGSWALTPAMPSGTGANPAQTKLWLWSNTPFDSTRHTSGSWADWFGSAYPDYPCVQAPIQETTCFDFSGLDPSAPLIAPWTIPGSGIRLGWFSPQPLYASTLVAGVDGLTTALCFTGGPGFPGAGSHPSVGSSVKTGPAYAVLLLDEPADEVELTLLSPRGAEAIGIGLDAMAGSGATFFGPFSGGTVADPRLVISGSGMREVIVEAPGGMCLLRVCVTRPGAGSASPAQVAEYEQRMLDALATWSGQGYVFAPQTNYRLKLVTTVQTRDKSGNPESSATQTQVAYFQTQGPPALANLSLPPGAPNAEQMTLLDEQGATVDVHGDASSTPVLRSDLNTLGPYVEQTVPATVPAAGQRPLLPRPVYRAYDVGVKFNEDYVDLLYRVDRRDLALYLYDANNRPVRDAQGRLIVLSNPWGVADQLSLSESDLRWVETVNASDCASLDVSEIPRNTTLTAASDQQVLSADFVYEARLQPLLLHDDFAGYGAGAAAAGPSGALGPWTVHDDGTTGGPSSWQIGSSGASLAYFVTQTSPIAGGSADPSDPDQPGTVLLVGDSAWTDVRISVYVRSATGGAIGVVFRYQDPSAYYRFSMDRGGAYRRLVRVAGGAHTILAQDAVPYPLNTDQLVTIEAAGAALGIYVDGEPVFLVQDTVLTAGRTGLYCHADGTACFTDARIDDFRQGAPVAYRFSFTTSEATNFFHHLHSFDDRRWLATIDDDASQDASVTAALAAAQPVSAAPGDTEAKSYEALATLALGQDVAQYAKRTEVTRVLRGDTPLALLVRSPEPIDWSRAALDVSRATPRTTVPAAPAELKLVALTAGNGLPAEATVSLLIRDAIALDGRRIEALAMPGGVVPQPRPAVHSDAFAAPGGVLLRETFGPNALDAYTIVDEGTQSGPSQWSVLNGAIVQSSWIFGGTYGAAEDGKPGTMAITGSPTWTDVRIAAGVDPGSDGAVGVVFRYVDPDNHYRLAIDSRFGYRRLTKTVQGTTTVLWDDSSPVAAGRRYELTIAAFGSSLSACIDGEPVCAVDDGALGAGAVGFYSWLDANAIFTELTVESVQSGPVIWAPELDDLSGVTVFDDPTAAGGPSSWSAAGGELQQTSGIGDLSATVRAPGTWAAGGDAGADDVRISLRLGSDDGGTIGVMFRLRDANHYYRVSLDASAARRRLVKVVDGVATVLWEDTTVGYTRGAWHRLTIDAIGASLRASLDGVALFSVIDYALQTGQAAAYASGADTVRFDSITVLDLGRRAADWRLRDDAGAAGGPSQWSIAGGALAQSAPIGSGAGGAGPSLGTIALIDGRSYGDVRATVRLRAEDPHPIGLVLRYGGPGDFYRFLLDQSTSRRRLDVFVDGVASTLWSDASGFDVGAELTVTFDAAGDRLSGYVNGALAFTLTDDSLSAGMAGVYCSQNPALRVEHVELAPPPPDAYALLADRFADGDDSGWTIVDQGTVGAPSAWAATGGALHQTSAIRDAPVDAATIAKLGTLAVAGAATWTDVALAARLASPDGGTIGVCVRYGDGDNHYRFAMDSTRSYRRLVKCVGGTFTTLWEDGVAYDPSRVYDVQVVAKGQWLRGYLDGVPLFSVRDGDLGTGAVALYAWDDSDASFSGVRVWDASVADDRWAIADPFNVLAAGRWTFADEPGNDQGSAWEANAGALAQTTSLTAGSYATAGDPTTTDCRVTVAAAGWGHGAIGVVARYADLQNHYRLAIDAPAETLALVKRVAGTNTSLWSGPVAWRAGHPYLMTLDVVGTRLAGWVDGEMVCSVEDGDLAAGQGGVYTASESGARFADFRLGAPSWSHVYRFGDEPTPADGRRVDLIGGADDPSVVAGAGIDVRFAAGPGERGWAPRRGPDVDLRLVASDDTVEHTRRFLPDAEFAAASFSVLRKADGTAFFITDASLEPGTHRLALTYRRDNTANDPTSIVLSQAGDTNDEIVVLDVPWDGVTPPG